MTGAHPTERMDTSIDSDDIGIILALRKPNCNTSYTVDNLASINTGLKKPHLTKPESVTPRNAARRDP